MPIECPIRFPRLERDAFQTLDYRVMQLAFETHKALGRSCDEGIYHSDLAARLDAAGLGPSRVELAIHVKHGSFFKEYRLDLVVAEQAIYELKAARSLATAHEGQTMNYLLMAGCEHGKLVNFGGASVESRFVNNMLTLEERYRFHVTEQYWRGPETLKQAVLALIEDIGMFLEAPLYNQALVHHFGGPERALEARPMIVGGRVLGKQSFQMCAQDEAFRVTMLTQRLQVYRTSLQKLFALTDLKALHWINLNRHEIQFSSLIR